jgi:hypothetical protein
MLYGDSIKLFQELLHVALKKGSIVVNSQGGEVKILGY